MKQIVASAGNDQLNSVDQDAQILNYYDAVQQPSGMTALDAEGSQAFRRDRNPDDQMESSDAAQRVESLLRYELKPNHSTTFRGVPLITNRWGQRDRDYEKSKPPRTFRIALVGASNVMGSGVACEDAFATLLETRMESELPAKGEFDHYEVINFAVNGYFLVELLYLIDHKVSEFDPDLILLCLSRSDRRLLHSRTAKVMACCRSMDDLQYSFLKETVTNAGLDANDFADREAVAASLAPRRDELVTGALNEITEIGKKLNVPVAVVLLHLHAGQQADADIEWIAGQVESAGLTAIRIYDSYANADPADVYLSESDFHPTPLGHRLLADEIFNDLLADLFVRGLLLAVSDNTPAEGQ